MVLFTTSFGYDSFCRINLAPWAQRPIYLEVPQLAWFYDVGHGFIIQIMKRFYSDVLYFFVAVSVGVVPQRALAEFVCVSDISYKWAKQGPDGGELPAGTAPGTDARPGEGSPGAGSSSTPLPEKTPASGEALVSQVRFASVTRTAADEEGAKASLVVEVNRQKGRASERCKRDHESFGDCLATKLSTKAGVLNSLGFSTRSQLEQALTRECQTQQGTCLGVDSSEPVCREVTPAPDTGAKGKGAEAGKKEDPKAKAAKKK